MLEAGAEPASRQRPPLPLAVYPLAPHTLHSCPLAPHETTGLGDPQQIAAAMRAEIFAATGCTGGWVGGRVWVVRSAGGRKAEHAAQQLRRLCMPLEE
mgnify:CR=1 FL=1